jgi:hypothetical protein
MMKNNNNKSHLLPKTNKIYNFGLQQEHQQTQLRIHKIYVQVRTVGVLLAFYANVIIFSSLSLMTVILFVFPFHFEALQEFDLYSVLNSH